MIYTTFTKIFAIIVNHVSILSITVMLFINVTSLKINLMSITQKPPLVFLRGENITQDFADWAHNNQ